MTVIQFLYQNLHSTNKGRSSLIHLFRRSCIRRNGNCDHRPNDCCYQSSCRCNLWGSNCRCQRMGLFQKWGNDCIYDPFQELLRQERH
uniref:CSON002471 protein n=1 Tax=Culicoides sonorensis TaxID=179676 RepID=A0A336K798_CULSO